jgi:hypothetical protein
MTTGLCLCHILLLSFLCENGSGRESLSPYAGFVLLSKK